jgi:signal transduction histidine kinase
MKSKMQALLLASITHDLRTPLNSVLAFNKALIPYVANNHAAIKYLKI